MRITGTTIKAFGHFKDRIFEDLDHPIVVIEGGNEVGKSTLSHFFQTMLYGIYPVEAEKHPYATRDGNLIEGAASFRLENGAEGHVIRRLMNRSLQGRLEGSDVRDLRNYTLPAITHIPQKVFTAVYALAQKDMTRIDGDAWDEVQDRLLGGLSIDYIRPARGVIEALETEAKTLWRTDRRRTQARDLTEKRISLLETLRVAREQDKEMRALHDEIEGCREEIAHLEAEKLRAKALLRKIDRLSPIRNLLVKKAHEQEKAGDLAPFADVPQDPLATLKELDKRIQEVNQEIQEKENDIKAAEREQQEFTEDHKRILEHAVQIRAQATELAGYIATHTQLGEARAQMKMAREKLEDMSRRLLTEKWKVHLIPLFRDFPIATLRERIRLYREAEDAYKEARTQAKTIALSTESPQSLVPWLVLIALGIAVAIIGYVVMEQQVIVFAGLLLLIVGALQAYNAQGYNRKLHRTEDRLDVSAKEESLKEQGGEVLACLEGLPLPEERKTAPDAELISDVQAFQENAEDLFRLKKKVETLAKEVQLNQRLIFDLAKRCGLFEDADAEIGSIAEIIAALEMHLNEAVQKKQAADEADARLPVLKAALNKLQEEKDGLQAKFDSIKAALALIDEDPEAAAEALKERRSSAQRAEFIQQTLDKDHPDWETLREEIQTLEEQEGQWAYDDEEVVALEEKVEQLEAGLRTEGQALVAKEKDLEQLEKSRSVGDIEGELADLDARLEAVKRDRDRKVLLARIIAFADRRFREKHQPDVIRLASKYLNMVTAGRYPRLDLDESNNLQVYQAGEDFPQAVNEPLSRGTRDQIYLAIRLAIIDHLDAEQERLPVFLDEVFVNWDPCRRKEGYAVLRSMAEHRQVFLFTCHPGLAQELEQEVGGHRVLLALPDSG